MGRKPPGPGHGNPQCRQPVDRLHHQHDDVWRGGPHTADIMLGVAKVNWSPKEPGDYIQWLRKILAEVHVEARRLLQATQERQKKTYDLRLAQKTYDRGDLVWVVDSSTKIGRSSKLHPPWKGPVLITSVLSPVLYEVEDRKGRHVLHHDKLKPCRDRSIPLWLRRKQHELLKLDTTFPSTQEEAPQSASPLKGGSGDWFETLDKDWDDKANWPSDLDETLPYGEAEDMSVHVVPPGDLEETLPYEDHTVDYIEELEDFGLDALFEEPLTTRSGRRRKVLTHLNEYVY